MKILLINDYGTPTGGAELLMLALREGLRKRGHDARLFTSSARAVPFANQADVRCFGTTSRFRTLLQTFNPWAYWRLRRILGDFHPDIVHVGLFLTQLSPSILPLLRQTPSLYFALWYRTICPLGTKMLPDGTICRHRAGRICYQSGCLPLRDWGPLMVQMKLWRGWSSAFDLIVANSYALQERLRAEEIDVEAVVHGGVPPRSPRPPLAAPPTASFVGRLVREKGVDTLIEAFARVVTELPTAKLVLIGDGPEQPHLHQMIARCNLAHAVYLVGQLPKHVMENTLETAWVQVVPSRWEEPFGLTPLDAMMRGTAVIASRTGGLAETVEHERTGLLVTPSDPCALAAALLVLLKDRDLAERMGAAGRELAMTQFTEDQFVDRFLQLYARILAKSAERTFYNPALTGAEEHAKRER